MEISSYSTNSNHFWVKAYCHRTPTVHGFPSSLILSLHVSNEKCQATSSKRLGRRASKRNRPCHEILSEWFMSVMLEIEPVASHMLGKCSTTELHLSLFPSAWDTAKAQHNWSFSPNEETQAVSTLDSASFPSQSAVGVYFQEIPKQD